MKKNRKNEILELVRETLDDDGCARIDIRAEGDLFDALSFGKNLDLDGSVYDFIDNQANLVPANIPLKVRFHGNFDEETKDKIVKAMHRHYTMKSLDVEWDKASNFRKMILLSVFGVAVLAVYFYLTFAAGNPMATEILSIIGSFSLWEASDCFLLERPTLKRRYANIMQNLNQKIEFVPLGSEESEDKKGE